VTLGSLKYQFTINQSFLIVVIVYSYSQSFVILLFCVILAVEKNVDIHVHILIGYYQ